MKTLNLKVLALIIFIATYFFTLAFLYLLCRKSAISDFFMERILNNMPIIFGFLASTNSIFKIAKKQCPIYSIYGAYFFFKCVLIYLLIRLFLSIIIENLWLSHTSIGVRYALAIQMSINILSFALFLTFVKKRMDK